jgi:23S rRNA pseudouridine2605 synthase
MDLLPRVREYVYPVGRLDYDSEGLLLLTNDGDLASRLTHPRHEVERVYEARVRGLPTPHEIERLERGIVIEGRRTAPAKVTPSRRPPDTASPQSVLLLSIHEGRHRQVRKMLDAVGHPIVRLRRVRIGPIADDTLRTGQFRDLTATEVARLKRAAGM